MTDERELREPTPDELQRAARLLSVIERRRDDGTLRYSDSDVLHFLPLVFLSVAPKLGPRPELPDAVVRLLGLFAAKAGIDTDASPDDVTAAVERYYEEHPVNPELLAAFQGFVREELASGGAGNERAFTAFLGDEKGTVVPPGGPRPEGSVPGGPLARLASLKPSDDE